MRNKTEQELLCEHFVSLYGSDMEAFKNGPEANASWNLAKDICPPSFNNALSKDSLAEFVKSEIGNMRKTSSTADDIDKIMSLIIFLRTFDPATEYVSVLSRDVLVNEFDVKVAMNACLAKYDLGQVPSIAEIKALDDALDKISPSQPGDLARERCLFEHYSKNLKESLFVTQNQNHVKSIFRGIVMSSPNIIEPNGDDSKFAEFYIKHVIGNESLNRLTDSSKFLNLLESDKLKVFRFIEARKICIKYIFKNHLTFLNIFFKDLYSETKDPNVQPFLSAYIRYILVLHNYVEKSFTSQSEIDQSFSLIEEKYNEAASKDLVSAEEFKRLNELPPKAKVNAVPLKCSMRDATFNTVFKKYLAGEGKLIEQYIAFNSARAECLEYIQG